LILINVYSRVPGDLENRFQMSRSLGVTFYDMLGEDCVSGKRVCWFQIFYPDQYSTDDHVRAVSLPVPILTIGEHELYEWHVPSEEIRSRLTKPYMLEYYNRPRYIKWLAQVRLSINTWEGGPDDIEGIVQHANSMEIRETLYETEEEFIISD
jgi:hypothetical protein